MWKSLLLFTIMVCYFLTSSILFHVWSTVWFFHVWYEYEHNKNCHSMTVDHMLQRSWSPERSPAFDCFSACFDVYTHWYHDDRIDFDIHNVCLSYYHFFHTYAWIYIHNTAYTSVWDPPWGYIASWKIGKEIKKLE